MISGDPVCSDTSVTASPASRSALAVPPVESRRTPAAASAVAKGTSPDLSETESSAVLIGTTSASDPATEVMMCGADDIVGRRHGQS